MSGIELSNIVIAKVVAALGQGQRPIAIDRARIDQQLRNLALDHAAGRLADAAYLERRKVLLASREEAEATE
jgi:hypothetical protein